MRRHLHATPHASMLRDIPRLDDYGISPVSGFLPDQLPLQRLPDPYYAKWETIVSNLQGLLLSRRLRPVANSLPILSTAHLRSEAEWRRAYSILAFITHAYIWGGDGAAEVRSLATYPALPLLTSVRRPGCACSNHASISRYLRPF